MPCIDLDIAVNFEGVQDGEQLPPSRAFAFDSNGALVASAVVDAERVALPIPEELAGDTLTVLIGPDSDDHAEMTKTKLARRSAQQKRFVLSDRFNDIAITVVDPNWRYWGICSCLVRGRLVKTVQMPDGTTKDLPILNARVKIYEVDDLPWIIERLPVKVIWRIREELLRDVDVRTPVIKLPPPPPPPLRLGSGPSDSPAAPLLFEAREASDDGVSAAAAPVADSAVLKTIAATSSVVELRRVLSESTMLIRPYLCDWRWFWDYTTDLLATVEVDEDGRFSKYVKYPCAGDHPDIYITAQQYNGSSWVDIYSPSVACSTRWNHPCGSDITIHVTSPLAVPSLPEDPVITPAGVDMWVMPHAIGGTLVWGTPAGSPTPPAPAGFIRTDGLVGDDAPFGSTLGVRMRKSPEIPNATIGYYRWLWRRVSPATTWSTLLDPVSRTYVRKEPGQLPTMPVYALGPRGVGPGDLFEFRPHIVPDEAPADPAGTTRSWDIDPGVNDLYSAYMNTNTLVGGLGVLGQLGTTAGDYELKLEVYSPSGTLLAPGPGTFSFVVPSGVAPDGTLLTRLAQASELDAGGYVFRIHIDNNPSTAELMAPAIGATSVADECGFLRYPDGTDPKVTIAFTAYHPNDRATFSLNIVRGATSFGTANAAGEVGATVLPAPYLYTGDGDGKFTHDFDRTQLTEDCDNAAFAEYLYVAGKATDGWNRIGYDASALRGFAIAEEDDDA